MKIVFVIFLTIVFSLSPEVNIFCEEDTNARIEAAKQSAGKMAYQEAYEKLLAVVGELNAEIDNLKGVTAYYKEEVEKFKTPQVVIDKAYNEAANNLWASAWSLQHEGIFKKVGREKEEALQQAVDVFKRIVIDYPYADKAEEAQYRSGRIYYKFLKDYDSAKKEFQRYISMYPKGRFVSDVKSMLSRIEER